MLQLLLIMGCDFWQSHFSFFHEQLIQIFSIEMNILKIARCLNQLDSQHESINQRFSAKLNSNYVYKSCLVQDLQQDLRIYGHTHADTILKLKKKRKRPQELSRQNIYPILLSEEIEQKKQAYRAANKPQSAEKPKMRKKNKVLEIYSIAEHSTVFEPKKLVDSTCSRIQLITKKSQSQNKNLQTRKNSQQNFRKYFKSSFAENIESAKAVNSVGKADIKTQIIISKKIQEDPTENAAYRDLALPNRQAHQNYCIFTLGSSERETLIKLNCLLFETYAMNLPATIGSDKKDRKEYCSELGRLMEAEKWRIYLVAASDLTVYQFEGRELSQMYQFIQHACQEKFVHLHIVKAKTDSEFELIYEEFIVTKQFSLQYLEWPQETVRYFVRRFLLLGGQKTPKQVVKQQERLIYEEYRKLPPKFYRFIYEMKSKPFVFVDHRFSRTTGWLHELLQEGFRKMEARRLNWQRHDGALDTSKSNEHKQLIYFYICLLVSIKG